MDFQAFEEKIWLSAPFIDGGEMEYIKQALDENWVSTLGPNNDAFEDQMKHYVGQEHAVSLSSGTAAIHLAVKLAGVRAGDVVFCTDLTFAATVNPVLYEGGTPVLIDSERESWNMSPEALERAFKLYPHPRAVIVADLYGTPARLDEIRKICDRHGVILIEDAAEALGADLKGKKAGSFGRYNILSFNGNKIITTSGGGMLLSDEHEAIERARFWATQSRDNAPWYQHTEVGYNYRLSNVLAGIGRAQMEHLEEHISKKKAIYERYAQELSGLPVQMNPIPSDCTANYWLSSILIDKDVVFGLSDTYEKVTPGAIRETLIRYNVDCRPLWKPMHLQPLYARNEFVTATGEDVSADLFDRGLCLPSDIRMTTDQQHVIAEMVRSCFRKK